MRTQSKVRPRGIGAVLSAVVLAGTATSWGAVVAWNCDVHQNKFHDYANDFHVSGILEDTFGVPIVINAINFQTTGPAGVPPFAPVVGGIVFNQFNNTITNGVPNPPFYNFDATWKNPTANLPFCTWMHFGMMFQTSNNFQFNLRASWTRDGVDPALNPIYGFEVPGQGPNSEAVLTLHNNSTVATVPQAMSVMKLTVQEAALFPLQALTSSFFDANPEWNQRFVVVPTSVLPSAFEDGQSFDVNFGQLPGVGPLAPGEALVARIQSRYTYTPPSGVASPLSPADTDLFWDFIMHGAPAPVFTWSGMAPGDNNWVTGANWAGGLPPLFGSELHFGPMGGHVANLDNFPAANQFNGFVFDPNAPVYNLTGTQVTLGGPVVVRCAVDQMISLPLVLTPAGNAFNTAMPNETLVVNGAISESALIATPVTLMKMGPGTLRLGGLNSYTGGTTVQEGILEVATNASLPPGIVTVMDGATMVLMQKAISWTANPNAIHNIGLLVIGDGSGGGGGAGGVVDVQNNLINVNYGTSPSPYPALASAVNVGRIIETTGVPSRTVGIYDTALNLDGTTTGGATIRVGYACPGDTMLRGYVNSSDIINIFAAGKYGIGPSNARWDEGDFTHDSRVSSSDIVAVLAAGTYNGGIYSPAVIQPQSVVTGPPLAGRATVIYDALTGDVKIDPNGNTMTSFRLRDDAANFWVTGAVLPAGGAFTTDDAQEKFWSTFNVANYLNAIFDLGDIAPAGLTEAQFVAGMNAAVGDSVWTKAGGGVFDYNIVYTADVPEPAALALLALGGLTLLSRRRR